MKTCSLYVPGYIYMTLDEPSLASVAIAADSVLYGPEEGLTTMAPEGGDVRDAARTNAGRTQAARNARTTIVDNATTA